MDKVLAWLAQVLNPQWVADQLAGGDAAPFFWWTVLAFAVGYLAGYARERRKLGHVPMRVTTRGLTGAVKEAAEDALGADGLVPVGKRRDLLVTFARSNPGVFEFTCSQLEHVGSGDSYQLTAKWRAYLARHGKLLQ